MVMYIMTRQTSSTYRSAKLKVCKILLSVVITGYQMRIGCITCVIYNTLDNLRIALEDNLIENSAKNSENHKLRINHRPTMQRGLVWYVMYVSMMFTLCICVANIVLYLAGLG